MKILTRCKDFNRTLLSAYSGANLANEADRLVDAGCGEGLGLRNLLAEGATAVYLGPDISYKVLYWGQRHVSM